MEWSCRCGKVEMSVDVDASNDSRLVCYCASCRKFADGTGAGDTLDTAGGVDLYQTAVERVALIKGAEHLAWARLTDKGPLRWFATCCGAPVANTLSTRQVPFATMMVSGFKAREDLPPVMGRVNKKDATARIEGDTGNPKRAIRAFLWRALKSRLNGGYKRNPFFDATGRPIADGPTDLPGRV